MFWQRYAGSADIEDDDFQERYLKQSNKPFDHNGSLGTVTIHLSFEIKAGGTWVYDNDECLKCLGTPTDSCNCKRFNGKQGGRLSYDCYTWKIDPNLSLQAEIISNITNL